MAKGSGIEAYNVKAKEKQEMATGVIINRNGKRCMAGGTSTVDGQKMSVTIGLENAKIAISEGRAVKGTGWSE